MLPSPAHTPHHRVSIVQDVDACLLVAVDLVASDGTFPVSKDNNSGTQAAVYSVTLQKETERSKQSLNLSVTRKAAFLFQINHF